MQRRAGRVGLAAIQIGVPKRIVAMDVSKSEVERHPLILINPEILWASEERLRGGLPLDPGTTTRKWSGRKDVRFRYTNLDGQVIEHEAEGLMATCIQHEMAEPARGSFIDYLARLKRDRIVAKFRKAAKRESVGS